MCDFISICSGISYISTQWIHVFPGYSRNVFSSCHCKQTPLTIHETGELDTIDARIKLNLDYLWLISWFIYNSTNMYIYHWHQYFKHSLMMFWHNIDFFTRLEDYDRISTLARKYQILKQRYTEWACLKRNPPEIWPATLPCHKWQNLGLTSICLRWVETWMPDVACMMLRRIYLFWNVDGKLSGIVIKKSFWSIALWNMQGQNTEGKLRQYHTCWCPGS